MINFVKGFIIGIGKIIPGVSGAMLAISLGVYDKAIYYICNFKNDIKNSFKYLFPLGVGIIISIVLFSKVISLCLNKYYVITMLFFIGLITSYMFPIGAISFTRPFRYFYIFQSIMLAYFVYYLYRNKSLNNRILMIITIVSFLGIFYLSQITSDENSHLWYQFFFQNTINMY